MSEPARRKPGVGEVAERPAVRAGEREPALTIAFTTDDDCVDATWGEAEDQNAISSSRSGLRTSADCARVLLSPGLGAVVPRSRRRMPDFVSP
jgi:hypothetical protein